MTQRNLIQQASQAGNKRWVRRAAVLGWIVLLCFDPWTLYRLVRSYAVAAMLPHLLWPTLLLLGITWLAFRGMRVSLAQPTLDDSAFMQFGVEFDALTEQQCEALYKRRSRDFFFGRIHKDERESELRLQSEGAAYRLLRPGLIIAVVAYWAVCILGPYDSIREPLAITAIAFTWLAVAVLILPTMVRMWTQPNEVGEILAVNSRKPA